jgi:lipopolysaccharide transport system permease protein
MNDVHPSRFLIWLAGAAAVTTAAWPVAGVLTRPSPPGFLLDARWLPAVAAVYVLALIAIRVRRPATAGSRATTTGILVGFTAAAALLLGLGGLEAFPGRHLILHALLVVSGLLVWDLVLRRWPAREPDPRDDAATGGLLDVDQALYGRTGSLRLFSLLRYRELVRNLVAKDLKLKYRGSTLGFLWSMLNPLITIAVYSFAFTYILQVRIPNFGLFLLLGIVPWTFFASSLVMSTGAIVDNAGLMKNALFPRAVLPVSIVLFNLAQYLLTMSVLVPVMFLFFGVRPTWVMLQFPLVLGLQVVFTLGMSFFVATATAFFHDIRHLVEVGLGVLFWLTPIVYDIRIMPDRVQELVGLGPMASFIVAYQRMLYAREAPPLEVYGVALAYAAAALALGYVFFVSAERHFLEQT